MRVIHYSADAAVVEELYVDTKEETLIVVGEIIDRLSEEEFIEVEHVGPS